MRKLVILAAAAAMALTACDDIDIKDGKIPQEFVTQARQYAGDYKGKFDDTKANFFIEVKEDGTVVAQLASTTGGPFFEGCEGLGRLVHVNGDPKKQKLKRIVFELKAQDCGFEGDYFSVSFSKNSEIWVQAAKEYSTRTSCSSSDEGRPDCTEVDDTTWAYGKFTR